MRSGLSPSPGSKKTSAYCQPVIQESQTDVRSAPLVEARSIPLEARSRPVIEARSKPVTPPCEAIEKCDCDSNVEETIRTQDVGETKTNELTPIGEEWKTNEGCSNDGSKDSSKDSKVDDRRLSPKDRFDLLQHSKADSCVETSLAAVYGIRGNANFEKLMGYLATTCSCLRLVRAQRAMLDCEETADSLDSALRFLGEKKVVGKANDSLRYSTRKEYVESTTILELKAVLSRSSILGPLLSSDESRFYARTMDGTDYLPALQAVSSKFWPTNTPKVSLQMVISCAINEIENIRTMPVDKVNIKILVASIVASLFIFPARQKSTLAESTYAAVICLVCLEVGAADRENILRLSYGRSLSVGDLVDVVYSLIGKL